MASSNARALAEERIRAGDPRGALDALTDAVRGAPSDVALRVFLVQLLCVLGQWERAHAQLNVAAQLDATTAAMRDTVAHAIRCELMRARVFAGKRTPMVFGEPEAWLALLIESLLQAGQGAVELSRELAGRALEQAPASSGTVDGAAFEWLADGDSRLGPVLEACVNGKYYWIPFQRLARITLEPPQDLRDVVWTPATLDFDNGGQTVALIPTRYPGSESGSGSDGAALALARRTEWVEAGPDRWHGLGQRVWMTDRGELDLMSVREVEFACSAGSAPSTPDPA